MIWDNFSIFRTNCAIARGTRAYVLRGFLRMSRGGNDVRMNHRNVWYFWPTTAHNPIRSCMLEFCSSVFVVGCSSLSEVRQCWIQLCRALFNDLRPIYVLLLLLQEVRIISLQFSHMLKNNSFSLTQQKHYKWIYLDITAFQDFKVSLLLPHACEEFAR